MQEFCPGKMKNAENPTSLQQVPEFGVVVALQ